MADDKINKSGLPDPELPLPEAAEPPAAATPPTPAQKPKVEKIAVSGTNIAWEEIPGANYRVRIYEVSPGGALVATPMFVELNNSSMNLKPALESGDMKEGSVYEFQISVDMGEGFGEDAKQVFHVAGGKLDYGEKPVAPMTPTSVIPPKPPSKPEASEPAHEDELTKRVLKLETLLQNISPERLGEAIRVYAGIKEEMETLGQALGGKVSTVELDERVKKLREELLAANQAFATELRGLLTSSEGRLMAAIQGAGGNQPPTERTKKKSKGWNVFGGICVTGMVLVAIVAIVLGLCCGKGCSSSSNSLPLIPATNAPVSNIESEKAIVHARDLAIADIEKIHKRAKRMEMERRHKQSAEAPQAPPAVDLISTNGSAFKGTATNGVVINGSITIGDNNNVVIGSGTICVHPVFLTPLVRKRQPPPDPPVAPPAAPPQAPPQPMGYWYTVPEPEYRSRSWSANVGLGLTFGVQSGCNTTYPCLPQVGNQYRYCNPGGTYGY